MSPRGSGTRGLLAALSLTLCLAACGNQGPAKSVGGQASGLDSADANNNGGYVQAGPITYQLQISRELNPYTTEDSQYVRGLPGGTAQPNAHQEWYAVFLWAKNQTSKPQTTSDRFVIEDTQGNRYYPLRLDSATNPFAWTAQTLRPNETEPVPDTPASWGPTQGGLLLFKVSTSVYDNRPLMLYILGPSGRAQASISLDL